MRLLLQLMAGRGTDIKLGGNKDFVYEGKKKRD